MGRPSKEEKHMKKSTWKRKDSLGGVAVKKVVFIRMRALSVIRGKGRRKYS